MRPHLTIAVLTCLAVTVLAPSGCRTAPPQADSAAAALPADPGLRQLAGDLDRLRGDNGLYRGGIDNRPGLYESAYGLTVLRAAGQPVRVDAAAPAVRAAVAAALKADPLWNRYALALLERATAVRLHTAADVAALLSWQTPEGYFRDPASATEAAADAGYRLATTEAALTALDIFGVRLDPARAQKARAWLAAHPQAAATSLTQLRHAVHAAVLLGTTPAEDVTSRLRDWWASVGATERGVVRGDRLTELCSYVELATGLGLDLTAQRAHLLAGLAPDREPPSDPQAAAALATAWVRLGGPASRLAPAAALVASRRLPGGLLSAVEHADGDLGASLQVEAVRTVAGLPAADAALRAALPAHRVDVDRSGPGAAATWLAVAAASADRPGAADEALRRRAIADLPATLSAATTAQWYDDVVALRMAGVPVPKPRVVAWAPDTAEHRHALWLAVTGLALAGYPPSGLDPGPVASTIREGLDLLAHRSLYLGAPALLAARAGGWQPGQADRSAVRRSLAGLRGCPGAPALYRDAGGATDCTIAATLAAWSVGRSLGLDMPAG